MRAAGVLLLAMALAACSRGEEARQDAAATKRTTAAQPQDSRVRCAPAGAKDFTPDCMREVAKGPDGEVWIIRHPDGGFRRFVLIEEGRRIATADGSEEVKAHRVGPDLEVRVGNDRYLFPAAPASQSAGSGR
jgi:hypothetical protein